MVKLIHRTLNFTICLLSVFATMDVMAESKNVLRGAAIYNQNCGRCHNARPATEATEQGWSVIVPHMRVKAHLTRDEAMAVEAFLAITLTADKVINRPAEITASGEDLVSQLACSGCHKLGHEGGILGPALDGLFSRRDADFVKRKLRDPNFNNPATVMPHYPLSEGNIEAIVKYLMMLGQ